MNKEFIPYEQALELKELGFDEPCLGFYRIFSDGDTELLVNSNSNMRHLEAPTFSQVFRFFREKYKKVDYPEFDYDEQKWHCHSDYKGYMLFDTYEEAELACLKKLIEIVKEKKD
jgi:hypothetical protein